MSKNQETITVEMNVKEVYEYAQKIKGRFPEGEALLLTNAKYAYLYAAYIIKGPWPEGEEVISKDAESAYKYALRVLKRPWNKGRKAINKNPWFREKYEELLKMPPERWNYYY